MALWLAAGRLQLRNHLRYAEAHPLGDEELAELRAQASRHLPDAGLARDRVKAYEHPERLRRQARILAGVGGSLFLCAGVLALIGVGLLAF